MPPPRGGRAGRVVAWALILLSVAYMAGGRALSDRSGPAGAHRSDDSQPPFQLLFAGRYAVGVHAFMPGVGASGATRPATAPATSPAANMLPQVDAAADAHPSFRNRVRAAIVAGEIAGADAALARLGKLQPDVLEYQNYDGDARRDVAALGDLYRRGPGALDAASRATLLDRYDWFGRLALVHGAPPDNADRRTVIHTAVRTAIVAIVASLGALAGLAAGVVLLIVAAVLGSNGRLTFAYRRAGRPTTPFLEAFAAYLAGMVVISLLVSLLVQRTLGATWFLVAIIPVAFFWPLLRGVPWSELRYGLGWTSGRGVLREAGAGVLGYLAGLPLLAAGAVITLVLQKLSGADTTHPIVNEITRGGLWRVVQLFVLAAVWAPVVEETMFRGAFYHHLRSRLPWPVAAAFVGLLFAAIHPQGWAAIPVLGAIGFSFAAMREWRGSVIAPAVAHAINNGVMTVLLLLMMG